MPVLDDPLVTLGALLDDGFPFHMAPADPVAAHEFVVESHIAPTLHDTALHDSWSWDSADTDWIFGPHG